MELLDLTSSYWGTGQGQHGQRRRQDKFGSLATEPLDDAEAEVEARTHASRRRHFL
jgi:hypothetical protein